MITTRKLKTKYNEFMIRLGKGEDITDMLRKYIQDVINVSEDNQSLKKYCKELEKNMNKCIQKVGMIRYNPYQNTGSDLCFALALLDFEDNGVVINGVYDFLPVFEIGHKHLNIYGSIIPVDGGGNLDAGGTVIV